MYNLPSPPPGVNLSIQQLVNAILFKCKYANEELCVLPESELDRLDRKLHITVSAVRGFRNAYQKINQLPPELLSNILFQAQERTTRRFLPDLTMYRDHGRKWYSFLHVCRRWRGIVARSPLMWSTVDDTLVGNTEAPRQYLDRSLAAPLTVYIGINRTEIQRNAVEALLKHSSRFEELHLCTDTWYSSTPIYTLMVEPAPSLVSLSLMTRGDGIFGGLLPPIFAGVMPNLRELALEHFTMWPTSYFHNLTSIYLLNQLFLSRRTTLAFLAFLENSPMLEKLALVRAGPTLPSNMDVLPAVDRIIAFPNMCQVTLGDWPISAATRFLSYLSLPAKTGLYIWSSQFSDLQFSGPNFDLSPLLSLPPDISHLPGVQGITKWYLSNYSFGRPEESTSFYNPYTAIVGSSHSLYHHGTFRAEELLASLPRYPLHNVTSFVVRDWSLQENVHFLDRFTTADWVEIFTKLKSLESLRVVDTSLPRHILTALLPAAPKERKRKDTDGKELAGKTPASVDEKYKCSVREESEPPLVHNCSQCEVLCPKLSKLSIEHDPALDSLLITRLLKSRSNHGCSITSLVILDDAIPPAKTCSLHSGYHRRGNGSSSSVSSRDNDSWIGVAGEEYYFRIKEEEELLRQYVEEFKLELDQPITDVFVLNGWPEGWPEDVYTFSRF